MSTFFLPLFRFLIGCTFRLYFRFMREPTLESTKMGADSPHSEKILCTSSGHYTMLHKLLLAPHERHLALFTLVLVLRHQAVAMRGIICTAVS